MTIASIALHVAVRTRATALAAAAMSCVASGALGQEATSGARASMASAKIAGGVVGVVEFYNAGLQHYFISADTAEIAVLDSGAFGGAWKRTGEGFTAWDIVGSPAGTVPVCRFFGTDRYRADGSRIGPNSHFYTADPVECAFVMTAYQSVASDGKSYPAWTFENNAFAVKLPIAGACPTDTQPLYRTYNDGARGDPGHRYSTKPALLQAMTGWTFEGLVMCLPLPLPSWTGTAIGTLESSVNFYTTTATVNWVLDKTVSNVATYVPTGSATFSLSFVGCGNSSRIEPATHVLNPASDGVLTIDFNANPPTWHGTGLSTWTSTLICDTGSTAGFEGQTDYFGGSHGVLGVEAAGTVSADGKTIEGSDSRAAGSLGVQNFRWKFTRIQ
ncbi:MAG: hypothetical protein U1F54_02010 [Burkholderiales bacterium]